jgi:hypothetical protein
VGACAVQEQPETGSERGCVVVQECHGVGAAAAERRWQCSGCRGGLRPMETSAKGPGGKCGAHRGLNRPEVQRNCRTTAEQRRLRSELQCAAAARVCGPLRWARVQEQSSDQLIGRLGHPRRAGRRGRARRSRRVIVRPVEARKKGPTRGPGLPEREGGVRG